MNAFCLTLLKNMLEAGACGGILVFLALCVRRAAWFPKSALPFLWGTALLRFLLPFSVRSPLSVYGLAGRRIAVGLDGAESVTVTFGAPVSVGFETAAALVWGAGILTTAGFLIYQYARFRRVLRVALPLKDCAAVQEELKAMRHVRVYTCESIETPLSCGIFHPKILLPASMDLGETTLFHHAMLHEIEHIRGGHNLLKFLCLCALSLHWMNPLAWTAAILMGRDLELCCDENVLRRIGGHKRKGYALSLLNLAEKSGRPALFASRFGRTAVESRIQGIARYRPRSRLAVAAAAAMAFVNFFVFACMPAQLRTVQYMVTRTGRETADRVVSAQVRAGDNIQFEKTEESAREGGSDAVATDAVAFEKLMEEAAPLGSVAVTSGSAGVGRRIAWQTVWSVKKDSVPAVTEDLNPGLYTVTVQAARENAADSP